MQVRLQDIVNAQPAIGRWASLKVKPAMSQTLGMLIEALQAPLSVYYKQVQQLNKEIQALQDAEVKRAKAADEEPDLAPIAAARELRDADLEEARQVTVGLPIGQIKLSSLVKYRILPRSYELAATRWLVEMDLDLDADYPEVEEAEPIKEEKNA